MSDSQATFVIVTLIVFALIVYLSAPKDKPPYPGSNDIRKDKTFNEILREDLGMNSILVKPRPPRPLKTLGNFNTHEDVVAVHEVKDVNEIKFVPFTPPAVSKFGCMSNNCSTGFRI